MSGLRRIDYLSGSEATRRVIPVNALVSSCLKSCEAVTDLYVLVLGIQSRRYFLKRFLAIVVRRRVDLLRRLCPVPYD